MALFRGRLIDKPEQAMPENKYFTGGDVEHKVGTFGLLVSAMWLCDIHVEQIFMTGGYSLFCPRDEGQRSFLAITWPISSGVSVYVFSLSCLILYRSKRLLAADTMNKRRKNSRGYASTVF